MGKKPKIKDLIEEIYTAREQVSDSISLLSQQLRQKGDIKKLTKESPFIAVFFAFFSGVIGAFVFKNIAKTIFELVFKVIKTAMWAYATKKSISYILKKID